MHIMLSQKSVDEFKVIFKEELEIDFFGVLTLSPSWADEFLSPLLNQFGDRLILLPSDNLSVQATLRILREANKKPFRIKE